MRNKTSPISEEKLVNYGDYLRVAKYSLYIKKELFLRIIVGLIVTASYVIQAIMLAKGVGCVFDNSSFKTGVAYFLIASVCIIFRSFILRYIEGYTKLIGGKIKSILRDLVIDKLLKLGPSYQVDKRSGRFQSLVTDGVEYIEPYLVQYIPQVFIVFFSVLPIVIYIFMQSSIAGLIVSISILLAIFMPHILMRFYTKACIGYWREYAVLNAQYIDTMQGMNTLKLFNAEEFKGKELKDASEKFRLRQLRNTRNSLFSTSNIALMTGIATSVTSGVVAYQASNGSVAVSSLLTIMFLVIECVRPIGDLNNFWHASMMGFSVASEILEILDEPISTVEKNGSVDYGIHENLPEIVFDNVSFKYNSKREQALDKLNLTIKSGQTVAIVGESGAGKSTLVNLLLRFYDVDSGKITINGVDIKDYNLDYLRSQISVVFQNTYLFYGTIKDNLKMAAPNASDEDIIAAAKAANAHEFIELLPDGYNTIVGERGETLSGGQRQRLAIARAILKKSPILIMDEATSSVDASSEKQIQDTLDGLQGQFTTILIAHRLSTIQNAQVIFALDHGKLAESGTHNELLSKDGIYKKLIEAQFGGDDFVQ